MRDGHLIDRLARGIDITEADNTLRWWAVCMADAENSALEAYADAVAATKPSDYIAATSRAELHKKRAELYEKMLLQCLDPVDVGLARLWALQQPGLKAGFEGLESDQAC